MNTSECGRDGAGKTAKLIGALSVDKRKTYSAGTQFIAGGRVWTLVTWGNGRYGFRAESDKRVYTMPCDELHADVESGRATVLK